MIQQSTELITTLTTQSLSREFERSLTIPKIIAEALPICTVIKHVEPGIVETTLDMHLTRLVESLNLKWNLQPGQITTIIEDLVDRYQYESLEDFILVFKRARQGEFGELYRLDSAVIFGWMERYLEEKYSVLERLQSSDKGKSEKVEFPEITPETEKLVKDYKSGIDVFSGTKPVLMLTKEEIKAEGQVRPPRMKAKSAGRMFTDEEVGRIQDLKRVYGVKYHDVNTGDPLPNWIPFAQFEKEFYESLE